MRQIIFLLSAVFALSSADITGSNPANGACLCLSGNSVNIRATACGTVIASGNQGQCYTYRGTKQTCVLSGVSYEFFSINYGSQVGWIAGTYLNNGAASQCSTSTNRRCTCGASWSGGSSNVRTCGSTNCAIVGSINAGECFDHQGTEGEWYRITFNGQTAYSHRDYLSDPHTCGGGSTGLCVNQLCSSYGTNQKRLCDSYGCGNYGASRGSRAHLGWDVRCNGGATVYAPFAGTVQRRAYPYGDGTCCDIGFQMQGSGSWSGHNIMIFYCDPNRVTIPATVTRGQAVATHRGLHCGCYGTGMTDHIHYQLDYNGVRIDPASYIFC